MNTVSLDIDKKMGREGRQKNLKFQNWSLLINCLRRFIAEILPIRRKTSSNQSINQSPNPPCQNDFQLVIVQERFRGFLL